MSNKIDIKITVKLGAESKTNAAKIMWLTTKINGKNPVALLKKDGLVVIASLVTDLVKLSLTREAIKKLPAGSDLRHPYPFPGTTHQRQTPTRSFLPLMGFETMPYVIT